VRPVYWLGIFIPVAIGLELAHASAPIVFFAAAIGVIPTAALMGEATEQLAARSGPGIGGLLNVSFGNAPELIIAFFALIEGLHEVVKASIVGSIIGNILLVLGAAMLVGGLGRERQVFSHTAANAQSAMLLLALAALLLPAVFQLIHGGSLPAVGTTLFDAGPDKPDLEDLSLGVAIVLMGSYVAGLFFSLKTHRAIFNPYGAERDGEEGRGSETAREDAERRAQAQAHEEREAAEGHEGEPWSVKRAVALLALAGLLVGAMSELLVGSIEEASHDIGLSQFFVGVFVVAIVGNAAEHWVAVLVARKNQMDLAVNISIGSSAQIALFVAPLLVLLSFVVGPQPMVLVFNGYELGAMLFAVLIANFITQEGESNWFEGVQLLALYTVLGLVFYFA
jgi:Ca2+:H+ antiporter